MHNEIEAATSHLTTLLVAAVAPSTITTTSSSPPFPSILAAWQQTLSTTLHASLSHSGNWYPADPERGSAARALHWQPLAGGEGCSTLLIDACRKHALTFAVGQWTLWIDPSCVAIRMGPGPGRTTSGSGNGADFGSAAAMSAANFTDGIKVIYGSLPMPRIVRSPAYTHAQVHAPSQHALFAPAPTSKAAVISRPQAAAAASSAGNRVPSVTVSPSTPALDRTVVMETALESADATPVVPWTSSFATAGSLGLTGLGLGARRRARRSSSSSSTSSSGSGGSSNVSRDSSSSRGGGSGLEATSSVGTSLPASSPPATWDKLDDAEGVPQDGESQDDAAVVVASAPAPAPLSLRNVDLLGLGLEDCGLDEADALAPEDAISVTGGQEQDENEVGEEDERDGEGDDTIRSLNEADETICATAAEEKVVPTPAQQQARPTTTTASRHSRTSSTVSSASSSVTSFDNGNVGVLGGGVKLGGASSSSASSASSATGGRRSRAMSGTSNHSGSSRASLQHSRTLSRTGGWAAQQQQQVQMQMQGGWYQQQQQQSQHWQQYAPQPQQQQQQQHFQYPAPPQQQQQQQNALGLNNMMPPSQHPRQQVYDFQPVPQHQQHSAHSPYPPAPPLETVPLYKRREAGPASSQGQQKFSVNVTLATADEANASRMPSRPASATSTSSHDDSGNKLNNGNGNGCLTPSSATLAPLPSPALSSTGSTTSSYGGETDDGGDDNESDVEGDDDEQDDGASKPRRTRTRGRRSRGRGAGRAARRAAAAAAAAAATAACLPAGVAGGAFPTPPVGAFGSPALAAVGSPMIGAWGKPLPSPTGASPFLQQQARMGMMFNNSSSPQMSMSGSPALHQHAIPPRPAFNGGGARPQHPHPLQQQHQQRMVMPQYAQHGTPSLPSPLNGGGGW